MSTTLHPAAWPVPSVIPVACPSPIVTAQAALRQARLLKAHMAMLEDLAKGSRASIAGWTEHDIRDLHTQAGWTVEGLEKVIQEMKS